MSEPHDIGKAKDGEDMESKVESRLEHKAPESCPFCGKDSCYQEAFEITYKTMGFDYPQTVDVVYCHDCGAMAPHELWGAARLREQLAAEREKVKQLREALERIRDNCKCYGTYGPCGSGSGAVNIADDALDALAATGEQEGGEFVDASAAKTCLEYKIMRAYERSGAEPSCLLCAHQSLPGCKRGQLLRQGF